MNNFWCSVNLDDNGNRLACELCVKGRCQSEEETLTCPNNPEVKLKKMGEVVTGGYAKFNSLPTAEKTKILKERSHQHFKKHILDKKVQMNRKVDPRYEPKINK